MQGVVLAAAVEGIVAISAVNGIAPCATQNGVIFAASIDCVVAVTAGDGVVAFGAEQAVVISTTVERVVASSAFQRVLAFQTSDAVVAAISAQQVGEAIAGDGIVAAAAKAILDQRGGVVLVEQRIGDIAARQPTRATIATGQVGELVLGGRRPLAGPEVDRDGVSVVREVVGIDPAAVPEGHEDPVGRRRALPGAVDGEFSRCL